jgi:KDO2-lipid IV(A) lauroyltransferase
MGRWLYGLLGRVAFHLVGRDRRLALANLTHAFADRSEAEVRRMGVAVFEELCRNIFDVASARRWSETVRARELHVEGLDTLRREMDRGRGVLLMGGHQGAWELVAVALAGAGVRLTAMARPIREARLQAWLDKHRRSLGIETLKGEGLNQALEAHRLLKRGRVLAILADHRVRRGGAVVEFFGRPARFALGPVRLALRTGASILPVSIGRRPDGGHRIRIEKPVEPPDPRIGPARARRADLVRCVRELERMIQRSPLEWAWIHPRWEDRDAGARELPAVMRWKHALPGLFLAACFLMGGCAESKPSGVDLKGEAGTSSRTGRFKVRETVDGRLKWILEADSARASDRTYETMVTRIRVDFYDDSLRVNSTLLADSGVVRRATNDLRAMGHVTVISRAGDTLATETLEWNNARGRVKTNDSFRLSQPNHWMTGIGFESDPGLKNYSTKHVRIDTGGRSGPPRRDD